MKCGHFVDVFTFLREGVPNPRNDKAPHCGASRYGAGTRSRTRDLLITSQLLYQLSYTGVLGRRL